MLLIDAALIGAIGVGLPLCIYVIGKDVKKDRYHNEEVYIKEQLELAKMKLELEQTKKAIGGVEDEKINVGRLFK